MASTGNTGANVQRGRREFAHTEWLWVSPVTQLRLFRRMAAAELPLLGGQRILTKCNPTAKSGTQMNARLRVMQ
jgi:vacuolar-type H+-ATPase catalytic subunit A/Vma1